MFWSFWDDTAKVYKSQSYIGTTNIGPDVKQHASYTLLNI